MTNGMVERYQTSSSATVMGYDYHHQDGNSSLSGVFDAAFSAAASTSSRRGYPSTHYDGVTSAAMHQVFFFLCIGAFSSRCSRFSYSCSLPTQQVAMVSKRRCVAESFFFFFLDE